MISAENLIFIFGTIDVFSNFCFPQDTTLVFIAVDDIPHTRFPNFLFEFNGR